MHIMTAVLDVLFPPRCAFCGRLMEHFGNGVCEDYRESLPYRGAEALVDAGGFSCAVAFYYDDIVREGIRALKFRKTPWRAQIFGHYVAQVATEWLQGRFDSITYVPVSRQRNYRRGFDQGRLLAQAVAKDCGMRVTPVLRKVRHNRAQSSLEDAGERRANVQGAYRAKAGMAAGRRFLLIDDVMTTGNTLAACAETLMAVGAASVVCATVAGGHKGET